MYKNTYMYDRWVVVIQLLFFQTVCLWDISSIAKVQNNNIWGHNMYIVFFLWTGTLCSILVIDINILAYFYWQNFFCCWARKPKRWKQHGYSLGTQQLSRYLNNDQVKFLSAVLEFKSSLDPWIKLVKNLFNHVTKTDTYM